MALKIGNNAVANAFVGSSQVRRAYKGGTLVYQGWGPSSEREFVQMSAPGGPAQLLKVYGKTIVDAGSLQSNKTAELRAYDGGNLRGSLALNLSTLTSGGVVVFPDGLRGVGNIRDEAEGSTAIVRRAVVDLGSLTWYYSTSASLGAHFYAVFSPAAINRNNAVLSICAKYQCVTASSRYSTQEDKVIAIEDGNRVRIWDSAYTDPATFKAAMSGVMLDYPLATLETYTLDTPLPTDLTCEQGDILQRVSDNNCPFVGEMKFGL